MSLALKVRAGLATTTLLLMPGCTSSTDEDPVTGESNAAMSAETSAAAADVLPAISTRLGHFPAFPEAQLQESVAASLQAALDQAVADDVVRGATVAVIVADSGSWVGAAGVDRRGDALTADSRLLTR